MKTFLDCVPCFLRQALQAGRMATRDEAVLARIMQRVLREAADFSFDLTPPHMGQVIHRIVREESGDPDPYRAEKDRYNRLSAELCSQLRQRVADAQEPRDFALRLAIAGNVIDFGPPGACLNLSLNEIAEMALSQELAIDHSVEFWRAMEEAQEILYLGDNTGEIFFDRILLEYLPAEKVTFVVRGGPIINDITMEDLNGTGIAELVPVIDNGSNAPGTILEDCSEEFRQKFQTVDVVISKGQGNYETLSQVNKHIFHLLRVKCPVLARDLGCQEGSHIVKEARVGGDRT
jgi:uncharacterized protein with ATP-grasp and redox domains